MNIITNHKKQDEMQYAFALFSNNVKHHCIKDSDDKEHNLFSNLRNVYANTL